MWSYESLHRCILMRYVAATCDLKDCPLCQLDDDWWALTAPVPDHEVDHELFEQGQLGEGPLRDHSETEPVGIERI